MAQHNELGKTGEKKACEYLISIGYKILDTNWRFEKCELDIVCSYKNLIVFVEVKTRSSTYFGRPAEFVSKSKQIKLIEGAEAYLEENKLENEIRFDIIEIIVKQNLFSYNHIESAFTDGM